MNKKILITCIFVASILILATFTSVIGVQSTESSAIESPLFGIRTQKAIDVKEKTLTTFDYIKAEYTLSSLPLLENKLKYVFGIDVSLGQIEEIRNQAQNDPIFQQKLRNGQISQLLNQILEIFDITPESNNPQPNTIPPTQCPTQGCGWNQCSCRDQFVTAIGILLVLTMGLTIFILIPGLLYIDVMTNMGKCNQLASINPS